MADTMIERIARFLCERNGGDPDELVSAHSGFQRQVHADPPPPVAAWTRHTAAARSLLALLREPTDFMLEAALGECSRTQSRPLAVWEDMVDAALAQSA